MWTDGYTIRMAYQDIVRGIRPWNALGDFLNYWFCYATDQREALVQEPIEEPANVTAELHQWAAFCAASVEYLCQRAGVACPAWVDDAAYMLPAPFFTGIGAHKAHVQARLLQETPEPFRKRTIYCSSRAFANKYELAAQVRQPQLA